ncbi:MAG TPA: HNH endonuclease [Candidatus Obscuribacterales bacterium]
MRRAPTKKQREEIRKKTGGLCHICGGRLGPNWSADHVKPVASGGHNGVDNFLPACGPCNRLKWHRTPKMIKEIMQLGTYCRKEIANDTPLGREIKKMFRKKESAKKLRRKS